MLTGAGFRYDPRLAHVLGKQRLSDGIVHLMSAGMVEVFSLEENSRAAQLFRPAPCLVQGRGPANKVGEILIELTLEVRICRQAVVEGLQFIQGRHQCLGHVAAAVLAESPRRVRGFR